MGSTSYKLICMSMKWHFNATLYFHYCCCFVAIVGAIEELEVHGEGDAGNAQGMGCEMRTGSWDLKLVSSNELRFVATCKTHLFWHEAHKSIFDPFRSSFFSFVFCIHTDDAKQKGVKSFPWPRNPTPTPCVPWFVLVIWHWLGVLGLEYRKHKIPHEAYTELYLNEIGLFKTYSSWDHLKEVPG